MHTIVRSALGSTSYSCLMGPPNALWSNSQDFNLIIGHNLNPIERAALDHYQHSLATGSICGYWGKLVGQ